MRLIRCCFLAPLIAMALPACDELEQNQATTEQLEDPGDIQATVSMDTRLRQAGTLACADEETDPEARIMSTFIQATLSYYNDGEPIPLILEPADSITVNYAGQTDDLQRAQNNEGRIVYVRTYCEPALQNELLRVSLERNSPPPDTAMWYPADDSPPADFTDYYVSAPDSTIDLPPLLEFTSPADGENFQYDINAQVSIGWTPNNVDSFVTGSILSTLECDGESGQFQRAFDFEEDTGLMTVDLIDFFRDPDSDSDDPVIDPEAQPCDITLNLAGDYEGTADPALADTSSIELRQFSTTITFRSCPDLNDCGDDS